MAVRVGINGFGRIGRLVMRAAMEEGRNDVEFVAINDLGDVKTNAHLLKYDTMHGQFDGTVTSDSQYMYVNGQKILCSAIKNPAECPWGQMKIDVVLECTAAVTGPG